jgi:hypothetical protein
MPAEWEVRISHRFRSGEWRRPVWWEEGWSYGRYPIHNAHLSADDPGLIGFYENQAKAEADLVTYIRPGRYLTRYFSSVLEEANIRWWAAQQQADGMEVDWSSCELKFARRPQDIAWVYENGPDSCMKGFKPAEHPCRVYGAGDLAVAYIEQTPQMQEKVGGPRVLARALCYPANKAYGRVYPTRNRWKLDGFMGESHAMKVRIQLETQLSKLYWQNSFTKLCGARLLVLPTESGPPYYRMPFLDGGLRVACDRQGWHLAQRGYICDVTSGTLWASDEQPGLNNLRMLKGGFFSQYSGRWFGYGVGEEAVMLPEANILVARSELPEIARLGLGRIESDDQYMLLMPPRQQRPISPLEVNAAPDALPPHAFNTYSEYFNYITNAAPPLTASATATPLTWTPVR